MYPLPVNNWLLVKMLLILDVNNGTNINFVILPQVPEFSVKREKAANALKNINFTCLRLSFLRNFCCLKDFEVSNF